MKKRKRAGLIGTLALLAAGATVLCAAVAVYRQGQEDCLACGPAVAGTESAGYGMQGWQPSGQTPDVSADSSCPEGNTSGTAAPPLSYEEFMAGTLFIGDSRTNRAITYGHISSKSAFAMNGATHRTAMSERFLDPDGSGTKKTMVEAAGILKPARIVVCFGINGIAFMGEENFMKDYAALLDALAAASPGSRLIVQSVLPVSSAYEAKDPRMDNAVIDRYNSRLEELIESRGGLFMNAAGVLKNSDGDLDAAYDSGDGLHYNKKAYEVLFDFIEKNREAYCA